MEQENVNSNYTCDQVYKILDDSHQIIEDSGVRFLIIDADYPDGFLFKWKDSRGIKYDILVSRKRTGEGWSIMRSPRYWKADFRKLPNDLVDYLHESNFIVSTNKKIPSHELLRLILETAQTDNS